MSSGTRHRLHFHELLRLPEHASQLPRPKLSMPNAISIDIQILGTAWICVAFWHILRVLRVMRDRV